MQSLTPKSFTVIDAAMVSPEGDTTPINGIPSYHKGTFGRFTAKYPYIAAEKALTSINKHLVKYKDWFPTYDKKNPPSFIIVIKNIDTDKKYAYIGTRVARPQRVILGIYGRNRLYQWNNHVKPIDLAAVGYQG